MGGEDRASDLTGAATVRRLHILRRDDEIDDEFSFLDTYSISRSVSCFIEVDSRERNTSTHGGSRKARLLQLSITIVLSRDGERAVIHEREKTPTK